MEAMYHDVYNKKPQKPNTGSMTIMPQNQQSSLSATWTNPLPQTGGGYNGFNFGQMPQMPEIPTYSRDEILKMAQQRTNLSIDPLIKRIQEALEENRLAGGRQQKQMEVGQGFAMERQAERGQAGQRAMSESMRRRNIADSGFAQGEANRLRMAHGKESTQLEDTHLRALDDLAEYLAHQERVGSGQITDLEQQRGQMAQSMFDQLWMQEREFQNRAAQQAADNWMAQKALELQAWQANKSGSNTGALNATNMPEEPDYEEVWRNSLFQDMVNKTPLSQQQQQYMGWYKPPEEIPSLESHYNQANQGAAQPKQTKPKEWWQQSPLSYLWGQLYKS